MITDNKIWPKCLDKLSESISEKEMRMWIKPLKVERVGENLKLYAPNKFMKEEVEKNFLSKNKWCVEQYYWINEHNLRHNKNWGRGKDRSFAGSLRL